MKPIYESNFAGMRLLRRGKVRDIYDLGERLLIFTTDRLSAFDCVFPDPIPCKGTVLTQISHFWFEQVSFIIPTHVISFAPEDFGRATKPYIRELTGRSMLVHRAEPMPVECVVRGYLHGSAWREYQEKGSVCGIEICSGLKEKDRLPDVLFTPATKAKSGHDENITFEEMRQLVGEDLANFMREKSIEIYKFAHAQLLVRGVVLVDTKFEFGRWKDKIILIDECLTPDSSRLYVAETYLPGVQSESFDKQFVRDYLESTHWNKKPPAPHLPPEIIKGVSERYLQACKIITGKDPEC